MASICSIEGCDKKIVGRGWCSIHWQRWRRFGDPLHEVKPYVAHGLKHKHIHEYNAWINMKSRCYKAYNTQYHDYGGRGITVCERWLHSFENFYNDMGEKPSPGHSIDRKDNNGNYEPSNCRWATRHQQQWNKRMVKRNTSGYIGVCKDKDKWLAQIDIGNRENLHLGRYTDPKEAAIAYDRAAIFFRGRDAVTNVL